MPLLWDLFSLFPAYAGVILTPRRYEVGGITFPRLRGGDPELAEHAASIANFSPPTRG